MLTNNSDLFETTFDYIKKINFPLIRHKVKKIGNNSLTLLKFGTDFTKLARLGKFDSCFGRDNELIELMEVLARRQKGNPVLLGDPGVGKSAIVEHFANQIVANLVPFILQGRTIISLDLVQIVGGSSHRGDFENRLNQIIKEVLENPHIIIFIDEIHIICGAGAVDAGEGSGKMDAANILKPYLSRGNFQCIGASTRKEYEKIEKDPALSRRFQPIYIKESSRDTAIQILYNLRPTLESYHNIILEPVTLKLAVDLSTRYIHDRFLPDKAIDLIDQISAKEAIKQTDIRKVSLIRGIINSLSNSLEKLRLEAFRQENIVDQYIFQEINNTYKDFIVKWFENPTEFDDFKGLKMSSISENLLDQLKLLILNYSEKFLFLAFENKIKEAKLNTLTFFYNQNLLIFQKLVRSTFLNKKLDLSLYRIFIYIYLIKSIKNYSLDNKSYNFKFINYNNNKLDYFKIKDKEHLIKIFNFQQKNAYIYFNKLKKKLYNQKYFRQDILKIDYKLVISDRTLMNFSIKEKNNFKLKLFNFNLESLKPLITRSNINIFKDQSNLKLSNDEKDIFSQIFDNTLLNQDDFISQDNLKVVITADHLTDLLAKTMNIPLETLSQNESIRLLNLEAVLHERVIGQEEAISAIAKAIRRSKLGIQNSNRPIASFLFCGPTGVGKTEIVKALAYIMFGSEKSIIRFDMSEFMEKHSISRLIGAPAGYIGYGDGAELTDSVKRNPYSIVLFDEAEKAHPDILNILLQILEDGRLTDTQKRLISFENTIIILTSNAAAAEIQNILTKEETSKNDKSTNYKSTVDLSISSKSDVEENSLYGVIKFLKSPVSTSYHLDLKKKISQLLNIPLSNYKNTLLNNSENEFSIKTLKNAVTEKLSTIFLPEFLNRFDDIIVFKPLTIEQLRKIAEIMINKLIERVKLKNVNLIIDDSVKLKLAKDAYNPSFGARPLRRLITKSIEDKISEILLSRKLQKQNITLKFVVNLVNNIEIISI